MARVKHTGPVIKLYEIDTKNYLTTENILQNIWMLNEFITGGGLDYAKAKAIALPIALERFAKSLRIADITTLTINGQATETWLRKSGLLDSTNNTYKLSPIAQAILNHDISLSEYALLILSKQWIKITQNGVPAIYKDNILTVVFEFFASLTPGKTVAKGSFSSDFGKFVLTKYSSIAPGLSHSNSDAARYLVDPLLLSGIMVESHGNYSLSTMLSPFFSEYALKIATMTRIDAITCSEEQYFNCFEYGILEITFSSSLPLLDSNYAGLFGQSIKTAEQIIYYGAPGTGKSFKINDELTKKGVHDYQVKRVTFYPDYTYNDFVGGLGPYDANGVPGYKFLSGPFSEILRDAFDSPSKAFYLIIEEINRGNASAIFGDIFQLLDRDSSGNSKYTITNKEICDYLRGGTNRKLLHGNRFGLPSNLSILCTMNTADQNVFVLDSAFKRRFTMEYIPIDFSSLASKPILSYLVTPCDCFSDKSGSSAGTVDSIFVNTDLDSFFKSNCNLPRTWESFAKIVNERINLVNSHEETISEDKKLGPFFVTVEDLSSRKRFADKVLYYLKQDVFKFTPNVLVPSYQELYDRYINSKEDIFEIFAAID